MVCVPFVTFTCQSAWRNAPQTLWVRDEVYASLIELLGGDRVILVCEERKDVKDMKYDGNHAVEL